MDLDEYSWLDKELLKELCHLCGKVENQYAFLEKL